MKKPHGNKGRKATPETRTKLSIAQKKRFTFENAWNKGLTKEKDKRLDYERPTVFKKGLIPWNTGKTWKTDKRIARPWLGKKITEYMKQRILQAVKGREYNEKHWLWKGDDVGYRALHNWVQRRKGKATKCEKCGKDKKRFQWANIDHKYHRNINDWISLCVSCHKKHDKLLKRKK